MLTSYKQDSLAEGQKNKFLVEYRAGAKIGRVDALSRHVGAILLEGILDRKNIFQEQAKDAFCTKQSPGTYKGKNILDNDGILYKRRSKGNHQLVVTQSLIWGSLRKTMILYVAHPGVKRTQDLILLRYWWPGMRRSVEEYIQKCDPCQTRKEDREFRAPPAEVEMPTTLFEVTSMDITGPHPVTHIGNKY